MPNWICNQIEIRGDEDKVLALVMHAAGKAFGKEFASVDDALCAWRDAKDKPLMSDFDREDYPETFLKYDTANYNSATGRFPDGEKEAYLQAEKEQMEKYGVVGWCDYNLLRFGCKWNMGVGLAGYVPGLFQISVDTPWSEPDGWLERMAKDFGVTIVNEVDGEIDYPYESIYEDGSRIENFQ